MASALLLLLISSSHGLLPPTVKVYDGVMSEAARIHLDGACEAVAALTVDNTVPHILVDRTQEPEPGPAGAVECALDALLTECGDSSRYVEWWWRDEWRNLELHRDVDEFRAREAMMEAMMRPPMAEDVAPRSDDDIFRCPSHGHVLYLDVGPGVEGGPTVLWTAEKEEEAKEGREKEEEGASSKRPQSRWAGGLRRVDRLVVCPARAGRLLRFAGDTYHSVPRPANAYLDWDAGGTGGRIHTRAPRTPGDHESTAMRRSVILFNTWQDPPEGFGGGDEEEEGGGGAAAAAAAEQGEPRSDDSIDNASPEPRSAWSEAAAAAAGTAPSADLPQRQPPQGAVRVKVPLLGDRQRRGSIDNHFTVWSADGAAAIAIAALTSTTSLDVHVVPVAAQV